MLNGIAPILIFQMSKLVPTSATSALPKIPVVSEKPNVIDLPPIPIYLSEEITGLLVVSEDKNVDVETNTNTLSDGESPIVTQKGIGSTVTISLETNKNSIGISMLSAFIDEIFNKLTSKEYSVTYLHGATTIFRGLIAGYQVSQSADSELLTVQLTITKGEKEPKKEPGPNVKRMENGSKLKK